MTYLVLLLAVFFGFLMVIFAKPSQKFIRLLLAFSGSYLLSITILQLFPEVYFSEENPKTIGVFILIGLLLQSVLESFSKGVEHGHFHIHSHQNKFPLLLFISLCVHAFSEGLPIANNNGNLLWAIVVHKIPIAIVLTTYFIHSSYSKKVVFFFLFIFAVMSPLGVFIADKVAFFSVYRQEITALIIGVFLHISTIILFEGSENHTFNIQKFIAILLGIILTYSTLY